VSQHRQSAFELHAALVSRATQRLVDSVFDCASAESGARSIERIVIDVDQPLGHTVSIYVAAVEIYRCGAAEKDPPDVLGVGTQVALGSTHLLAAQRGASIDETSRPRLSHLAIAI
jgi:hypothetical protein